ncbi:MAG: hypothetical protein GY810_12915 [Aureispira sp.]|nr:hypothetical protein [Aureispira sp.]
MQNKVDKLFRLIKSMQSSEKVFFKKMANLYRKSGTSNYVTLFDTIDKQKEYDEEKLIKKLKGTSFIKHLAVSKNHLYENILRSLRLYRRGNDNKRKVYQNINDIIILKELSLKEDMIKKAKSTKALAWKIEEFNALHQLIEFERGYYRLERTKTQAETLQKLNEETQKVLDYQQNSHTYSVLFDQFMTFYNKVGKVTPEEARDFLSNKVLQDYNNALSFRSKHIFLLIKSFLTNDLNQPQEALHYARELVQLWHDHPQQMNIKAPAYWSALSTFISMVYGMNLTQEIKQTLNTIETIPRDSLEFNIGFYNSFHLYKVLYIILAKDFDLLADAVKLFLKDEKKYGASIGFRNIYNKQYLYFHYVTAYIYINDYENALSWNIELLDFPQKQVLPHYYYYSRLRSILIHYCLGNDYLLDSLIRSVERNLKKEDVFNAFEKTFIQLFKKLLNTPQNEEKQVLNEYLDKFSTLESKSQQELSSGGFDILLWIKSRIEKTSMLASFSKE